MKIPQETYARIAGLPGSEFIAPGLRDLEAGRTSTQGALLILMARSRLKDAGFGFLESLPPVSNTPESDLYRLLQKEDDGTACGRLHSLKQRLDHFVVELERQ